MKHYPIEVTAIVLTILWVLALFTEMLALVGLIGIVWHISAIMVMVSVFSVLVGMVLVTNTRRPAGIDPNKSRRGNEEFSEWDATQGERRVHMRRSTDGTNAQAAKRLIDKFEREDSLRPMTEDMPQWAQDLEPKDDLS